MGFALTEANEIVFDTLAASRKAVNLARNPNAALVIGWDDQISLQIEGPARRPAGDDLAPPRPPISMPGRTAAPARPGPTSPMSS